MQTNIRNPFENSYQSQVIQPSLMSQQLTNTQIQKQSLQQIPLVPLRQSYKSQTTIRPSIFKSKVEQQSNMNKDASCLIAKLDSLREIKTQESPLRHHKTTYVHPQSSVVVEFKNNTPKTAQLQQGVFASCVEPFRSSKSNVSSSVSLSQQWTKTLSPQKNYQTLIDTLMNEQDTVNKQYSEKLSLLEQKIIILSQENNSLIEQNKLLLTQNIELNEEITQQKNQVKQFLELQQINQKAQNDIEILEKSLEYKQDELNQIISNFESLKNINLNYEKTLKDQQDQINSIFQQKEKENDTYCSQITIQNQTIQEMEQKINQYIKNESSSQILINDLSNKLKQLQQQLDKTKAANQQTPIKINVKEQYEYKQLVLELDSKCVTITEKETQVEALKVKNSMLQQQLIQLQACQLGMRDYEAGIKQKQQEINELQQTLQRKNQEFDHLSQQQQINFNNKKEEYEKAIQELQQTLKNKNEELDKVSLELKTVKKEKAKLSMNLITAGMANIVMASKASASNEIST
ncbi:unnamed protein product [Paramecium sonneborni]|uniref:Uncharacterized protein n=1 Tax=Paramecium sonneborni TaxID=65129 RepID=A0A8S1PX82_9CILI|nr:unnamed protein product [Paramecium sonneborni]